MKAIDSLAVRYRPTTFNQVIGNASNINIIKGMVENKQIVKSWLLCGPVGCGKTTVARLLAKTVNCKDLDEDNNPCDKCQSCVAFNTNTHPDIHEINVGETGIEEIRSIIQQARMRPVNNFRVFILDECQALTGKSKDTILKPLEEPLPNVIWILSTMNPEKIQEAIQSRCTVLYFNYPLIKDTAKLLYRIAKKEFPKHASSLKPYLMKIVDSCNLQPRISIASLEKIGNAISISKDIDIEEAIKSYVSEIGELDSKVLRFIYGMLSFSYKSPLNVISELNPAIIDKFLMSIHDYCYYISLKIVNGRVPFSRNGIYGVSFIKADELVNKHPSLEIENVFNLMNAVNIAMEKLRFGIYKPQQAVTSIFKNYKG